MKPAGAKQLKEHFDRDGYISLPAFMTNVEMENIKNRLEYYVKNVLPGMSSNHVFYEDKSDFSTLKQLQDMHSYDPAFASILHESKFQELATILLGENVVGKTIEYFNKPPTIGKPTPPHQDAYYFMLKPPQALTMWLALEQVDHENGCVRYIKGSHLRGMRPHGRSQVLGFSQGITDYGEKDLGKEIAFPASSGDLLIHHSMTIHRADGNVSNSRSRQALGFIYFGESAQEDVEAKAAYQKKLAEERSAII